MKRKFIKPCYFGFVFLFGLILVSVTSCKKEIVIESYTITSSAGTGGSISPKGATIVASGESQIYKISTSSTTQIEDVIVDGNSVGVVGSYIFDKIKSNHTISVKFKTLMDSNYTISSSAGTGGTISPDGSTSIVSGSSQNYIISPNSGYQINNVIVDGNSLGSLSSYEFSNVTDNHTISASFSIIGGSSYTITSSAGTGGSISPNGTTSVASGGSQNYSISANSGYQIDNVIVDGTSLGSLPSYQFSNVTSNHTISVSFSVVGGSSYTITSSAGIGGSISPNGSTIVANGGNQTYSISANSGYLIYDVLVDGISIGATSTYTFTNVTTDHTISVTFIEDGCPILIELFDNYNGVGDGWNNTTLDVEINGISTYSFTLASGGSGTESFILPLGSTAQFIFVSGSQWDEEISYIISNDGTTLFSAQDPHNYGNVFSVSCQ